MEALSFEADGGCSSAPRKPLTRRHRLQSAALAIWIARWIQFRAYHFAGSPWRAVQQVVAAGCRISLDAW
jgi:hypothetical protein